MFDRHSPPVAFLLFRRGSFGNGTKWGLLKTVLLRSCAILVACTGASANATGILDNYTVEWSKAISTKEASSVAYNWDLKRLMVTNDEEAEEQRNQLFRHARRI